MSLCQAVSSALVCPHRCNIVSGFRLFVRLSKRVNKTRNASYRRTDKVYDLSYLVKWERSVNLWVSWTMDCKSQIHNLCFPAQMTSVGLHLLVCATFLLTRELSQGSLLATKAKSSQYTLLGRGPFLWWNCSLLGWNWAQRGYYVRFKTGFFTGHQTTHLFVLYSFTWLYIDWLLWHHNMHGEIGYLLNYLNLVLEFLKIPNANLQSPYGWLVPVDVKALMLTPFICIMYLPRWKSTWLVIQEKF